MERLELMTILLKKMIIGININITEKAKDRIGIKYDNEHFFICLINEDESLVISDKLGNKFLVTPKEIII